MKNKVHFTPSYFRNPLHPITISVIGCGGTGSLLLTRLSRIDYALKQLSHPGLTVTCYDDDIVEAHNVGRQNFTPNDIGQNKAFCLVSKLNMAYGLDWEVREQRIKTEKQIPNSNIIITCVDNAKLRMMVSNAKIQKRQDDKKNYYWLDCGNGRNFGQVILGTLTEIKQPKYENFELSSKLKTVVDLFGDLHQYDTEEVQGIESCSFIDSIEKQDLFINDEIALSASKIIWKLLKHQYISITGFYINQSEGELRAQKIN